MLRTATPCTLKTSQLRKVVRDRQLLTLLTSKCASRHNGVQFFISHLARWLCTRRFTNLFFHPPKPGKTERIAIFILYLFARLHLLSSDSSSDSSSSLIFFLLSFFFLLSSSLLSSSLLLFSLLLFFSSLFFSSLFFSSLLFSSLLFSDSSHLCFSICPYCRKFDF